MRLTGPIRHTGKWIRRHPALTALIVLAICASFGIIWQWQRAERERERAEAREVIPALIAALRDRTAQFAHVLVDTTYWKSFVHSGLATAMSDRGCISLYGTARTNHALFAEHVARSEFSEKPQEAMRDNRAARPEAIVEQVANPAPRRQQRGVVLRGSPRHASGRVGHGRFLSSFPRLAAAGILKL